ncbi:MAG: type 1 glutamine amidotransferase domain-containing protein [Rhodovibrionaceae bacterium]|nr:type 1 glutamine amidotransferase domain-containing protein [Rhodovibrionaceae bacterium]
MNDSARKILFVVTSNNRLGDTGKPTGFHWEELTTPYYAFEDKGYSVDFASPQGGEPPYDPGSLKDEERERPQSVRKFLGDDQAKQKLKASKPLDEVSMDDFAAVYLPGGHGTMWDLPYNRELNRLLRQADLSGKPIGAVCHGPAGFVGAEGADGEPLVKGHEVNCFTDEEEQAVGLDDVVPFLLESKLRELGGEFKKADKFKACVVSDGNLVTGQNPASCGELADKMLDELNRRRQHAAE